MAKRQRSGVLNRLAGKRIVFSGKCTYGVEDALKALAEAQQGTVCDDLTDKIDYLVLADLGAGKTIQKKAMTLNGKGAAIQVIDVDGFKNLAEPTQDEILALLKDGKRGAEAIASVAPPVEHGGHGAAPGAPRLIGACLDGLDLSGLDLRGIAFERCSFIGAKLNNTRIAEAIECNFSKATGDSPQFGKINCSSFSNAKFLKAEFRSHLEGSDFTRATLDGSQFLEQFWAAGVTKRPSDKGPCFHCASLRDCLFAWVRTSGANFSGAELSGSAFDSCHLNGANLRDARAHDAFFVAIDFRKADLSNASLVGSNLAEADLTGAKFHGADLTDVNLRGAKVEASALKGIKGVANSPTELGAVGPVLAELDSICHNAKRIEISFRVAKHPNDEGHELQISAWNFAHMYLPDLRDKVSPKPIVGASFSQEMLQAGRVFGHLHVRFETLIVKSVKSPKSGKALRDLVIKGIAEAFAQTAPDELDAAGAARYREKAKETAVAERERREQAKATAAKQKEKAKKQIAKKIEKTVGKVSDVASFLQALELRIEKPKIDKATKMLKASGFKLFNDVTDEQVSGVVKSQTDADLVYACRLMQDGQYACCTQNLNVCGGLRGSICKHLLVLIIGLVQAGELDPTTIDGWIAKTHSVKPELDKEVMGAIFIKYKGAEAGEVDWRPTETVPEDYYTL